MWTYTTLVRKNSIQGSVDCRTMCEFIKVSLKFCWSLIIDIKILWSVSGLLNVKDILGSNYKSFLISHLWRVLSFGFHLLVLRYKGRILTAVTYNHDNN